MVEIEYYDSWYWVIVDGRVWAICETYEQALEERRRAIRGADL
jgi:hypothetical protein